MKEWLKVQLEDLKDELLFSTPENFAVLQGKGQSLHKLIRQLEREPIRTNAREGI